VLAHAGADFGILKHDYNGILPVVHIIQVMARQLKKDAMAFKPLMRLFNAKKKEPKV
jgi:hypothetical protein